MYKIDFEVCESKIHRQEINRKKTLDNMLTTVEKHFFLFFSFFNSISL